MTLEEVGAHQVAVQLQDTWMSSASDSSPLSWGLQFAVADRVGLDVSESEQFLAGHPELSGSSYTSLLGISTPTEGWASTVEQARAIADSPVTKAYVDQVYNDTQALLKSQGVTEISMFRGVGGINELSGTEGTEQHVGLNPVSSFSLSSDTARTFAESSSDAFGEHGYILETTVPAERIFSTSFTGPGCLGETEMIVTGGPTDVRVSAA
jgi:Dinitrogenase reductase ADP-ribosyltransferase (DRAT)